jgi:hypothetical protein
VALATTLGVRGGVSNKDRSLSFHLISNAGADIRARFVPDSTAITVYDE